MVTPARNAPALLVSAVPSTRAGRLKVTVELGLALPDTSTTPPAGTSVRLTVTVVAAGGYWPVWAWTPPTKPAVASGSSSPAMVTMNRTLM